MPHSMPVTTNTYGCNGHLTNHTYQGTNIGDIFITNTLGYHIQVMINMALNTEGQPGQVIGLPALTHVISPRMFSILLTLLLVTMKHHHMPGKKFMRAICCHPS